MRFAEEKSNRYFKRKKIKYNQRYTFAIVLPIKRFGGDTMKETLSKPRIKNFMLFFDCITFREIGFGQSMYIKRAGPKHYLISSLVSSQNCKNLGHGIFLANVFLMPVEREGKSSFPNII